LVHSLQAQTSKPNIIVFIADDVSWDDLGAYGNKDVKTPVIDQ
jgi:N-sulfoglucosamine sulfohydrolase